MLLLLCLFLMMDEPDDLRLLVLNDRAGQCHDTRRVLSLIRWQAWHSSSCASTGRGAQCHRAS
jgi:hypothetical protein